MTHAGKTRKALALALSLLLALSFAPLFSVVLQQANAAVGTNRNSSNYVPGHYYYYPEGTSFIKSIHVGYDKDKDKAKNNAINDQNPNLLGQDWLDGMGSNIFKKYNYIYIAYGTTTNINEVWGTYIRMKHSSGTPGTYNFNVNGQSVPFTLGSDVDFNKDRGSGSDYIYLYKTNNPAYGLPITEFRSGEGNNDAAKWESYFLTAERDDTGEVSDFNRGAGGKYLWLHYGNYSVFTDVTTYVLALKAAIDEAGTVNEGTCTAASWQALVTARAAAQSVWNIYNGNAYKCATVPVSEIQSKTTALNNALNSIVTRAYTVNFNGAGNTGGAMTSQRLPVDAARNLSANGFTREFTVTYEYNGATDGNAVKHENAVSVFNGWATNLYGTVVYADRQSVQGLTTEENGQVDLYASWRDTSVTLPTPVKEGYDFDAWYTDPSCNVNYIAGNGGGAYKPGSNITLYAKWNEKVYSLTGFTHADTDNYSIQKEPETTAKYTDTVIIKLKLPSLLYNCEPVLTCNTGTVELQPHSSSSMNREYRITGISDDYEINIGPAVPPTYTVTFVDGLSGETLGEVTDIALGGSVDIGDVPEVDEYVDYSDTQHLAFTDWDGSYEHINGNRTLTSQYALEDHSWDDGTVITAPVSCTDAGEMQYQCNWCPRQKTEVIPAGAHSFTRKVISDDYLKSSATCLFPAVYYYCCANCSAKGENTYTEGSILPHNLSKTNAKAATCTEGGWDAYWTCSSCNRMFSDENGQNRITAIPTVNAKGHAPVLHPADPATCIASGTYAYYTCERCPMIFSDRQCTNEISMDDTVQGPTGVHALVKTEAVPVTCTADGSIAYWTCSVCQQRFADQNAETPIENDADLVVHFSGHEFTAQVAESKYLQKAANCTEAAVYYKSCAKCGEKGTETFVYGEPAGHDFYWVIDREPTCAAAGEKHEQCRKCTATGSLNTPIQPTGNHNYTMQTVKEEAKKSDATCTAPAAYYYSCSVCGAVEHNANHTFNNGSAKGHTFGAWVTDREATCSETGSRHRTCTVCDYSEVGSIAKTDHVDADGDYKCDACSADVTPSGLCPYCHGTHSGFPGVLVGLIHRILYFFKNLFG